ncbi:TD and POZ domain-containing protein 3 [Trichonephila clavata]|uniref:TD and POZ domain-containing protein 3 n=1 Tax=Trichonephila clavata TaxID=2740835 RepID=A0A8X6G5T3_TRICU|nr:TD and POZ domain-containing protein 3 [Trichonephila clavata]
MVIAKGRRLFDCFEQKVVWRFPQIIKKSELIEGKNQLLPNNELSLKCEFNYSMGILFNHMEFSRRGTACCLDVDLLSSDLDELSSNGFKNQHDSLNRAMKCLLEEGSFYDSHLQVGDVTFPVHKAILSARSPVFKAMFSQDMAEKNCAMVDIEDLDDDTVRQMLLYLYTDAINNFQRKNVERLYFAADKYEILCLKEKCASVLIANMEPSNVCQLLLMADLHQDKVLKSAAHDFIYKNDIQVLNLEEWTNFEENNPRLTSEALRYVCLKNRQSRI